MRNKMSQEAQTDPEPVALMLTGWDPVYTKKTATPSEEHRPGLNDTTTLAWIFKEIFPEALGWNFAMCHCCVLVILP